MTYGVAIVFISLLLIEFSRPLRVAKYSKFKRIINNLSISLISAVILRILFFPVLIKLAKYSSYQRWDFAYRAGLSKYVIMAVIIVTMDYTLYFWHKMNHRNRFLWRFHNVHHVDLDMDVSTAFRFHFGELSLSSGFRALQVFALGVNVETLILYEFLVLIFTQFHHGNIRLPQRFENYLCKVIVTPRMHGVHHSLVQQETDSNYSTVFSFWDKIHSSLNLAPSQGEIIIGVPAYQNFYETNFLNSIVLPFKKQRKWQLSSGKIPVRDKSTLALKMEC